MGLTEKSLMAERSVFIHLVHSAHYLGFEVYWHLLRALLGLLQLSVQFAMEGRKRPEDAARARFDFAGSPRRRSIQRSRSRSRGRSRRARSPSMSRSRSRGRSYTPSRSPSPRSACAQCSRLHIPKIGPRQTAGTGESCLKDCIGLSVAVMCISFHVGGATLMLAGPGAGVIPAPLQGSQPRSVAHDTRHPGLKAPQESCTSSHAVASLFCASPLSYIA